MNHEAINAWCGQLLAETCCAINTQSREVVAHPPVPGNSQARLIFPGSFNPLHDGHRAMAETAEDMLHAGVEFEMSIENVDKPPATAADVQKRLQRFPPTQTIWLTRARHFRDKAAIFPGATFIVGVDTITRIGDPRYYTNDARLMHEAIDGLARHGCRFLVFGRVMVEGFRVLASLELPPALAAICTEVPLERFRFDLTSTQLRIAGNPPHDE